MSKAPGCVARRMDHHRSPFQRVEQEGLSKSLSPIIKMNRQAGKKHHSYGMICETFYFVKTPVGNALRSRCLVTPGRARSLRKHGTNHHQLADVFQRNDSG